VFGVCALVHLHLSCLYDSSH